MDLCHCHTIVGNQLLSFLNGFIEKPAQGNGIPGPPHGHIYRAHMLFEFGISLEVWVREGNPEWEMG